MSNKREFSLVASAEGFIAGVMIREMLMSRLNFDEALKD